MENNINDLLRFLVAVIGGILYRLGGAGKLGDMWDFLRHTKARDMGVALLVLAVLYPSNWIGLLFTGLLVFGSLTLGYGGKGEPKKEQSHLYKIFGKYVFFAVGFLFGLALAPYAIAEYLGGNSQAIVEFIRRLILMTFGIPLIHNFRKPIFEWDSAQVEEFMRGFLIIITCFLF